MARWILATALAVMASIAYPSQKPDYSARLHSVLDSVTISLAQQKPEWRHRVVEPMKGSRNVSVNNWEFEDQIVRVDFIAYGSKDAAAEAMRGALKTVKPELRLPQLGDGGYSFGQGDSTICFWKADLCVCVSVTVGISSTTQSAMEFAKLVDAAIAAL